jgi:hypothetical protein
MKSAPTITPWARPWDVHCIERTRFPQPVSHRRVTPFATFMLGAIGGALLMAACTLLALTAA